MFSHEHAALQSGVSRVAGVDEAGRGPLAGPVVAAAVVFSQQILESPPPELAGINDSKALSPAKRMALWEALLQHPGASTSVAVVEPGEIDRLNILRATHAAMARALAGLNPLPEIALVDGLPVPGLPCPSRNIVKGDAKCFSIAAASIVAKVTRDKLMEELDATYPGYGFARHKGYGTRAHMEALHALGPCPAHRRSFAPVRQLRLF